MSILWLLCLALGSSVAKKSASNSSSRAIAKKSSSDFDFLHLLPYMLRIQDELPTVIAEHKIVYAFMGHEGGDLDSFAATIGVAILRYHLSRGAHLTVPIYNMPRAELKNYKDNVEVMRVLGIPESAIICLDDLPLDSLVAAKRLHLTLVDHNELSPRQEFLAPAVVAIVDHHVDAGYTYPNCNDHDRYINPSLASASSMVTTLMRTSGDVGFHLLEDPATTLLLGSAIIIDTDNLQDANKTTDDDRHVLGSLSPIFADLLEYTTGEWSTILQAKRKDISGLTMLDVILKDVKYAKRAREIFAVGSVKSTLEELLASTGTPREEIVSTIQNRLSTHRLHTFYVIFQAEWSGDAQLLVVTQERCWPKLTEPLGKKLSEGFKSGGFLLKGNRTAWEGDKLDQLDKLQPALFTLTSGISREQVLPFLEKFYANGHAKACDAALTLKAKRVRSDL